MIKEVQYNGYSTSPSDYLSPDGDLAVSINLLPEDGALRPLMPPSIRFRITPPSKVSYIHHTPAFTHYIVLNPVARSVKWTGATDINQDTLAPALNSIHTFGADTVIRDISAVGNTLIVLTDGGIHYFLWNAGTYRHLGTKPPFVTMEFAIVEKERLQHTSASEPFANSLTVSLPIGNGGRNSLHLDANKKYDPGKAAEIDNAVMGYLNGLVAEKVNSKGRFYQPFFVRYAFRLFDGTYAWHSAPVLMLPTVVPPLIQAGDIDAGNQNEYQDVKLTADRVRVFALYQRTLPFDTAAMELWGDVIKGIDIFVTAPIYTFDMAEGTDKNAVSGLVHPSAFYKQLLEERSLSSITPTVTVSSGSEHTTGNRNPASSGSDGAVSYFEGHFIATVKSGSGSFRPGTVTTTDSRAVDQLVSLPDGSSSKPFRVFNIAPNKHFIEQIMQAHDFYRVASYDMNDIKVVSPFTEIPMENPDMTALVTRPVLPDDFCTHASLAPNVCFEYNSRLNIADIDFYPARPLPPRSLMAFGNPSDGADVSAVTMTVWLRKNGTVIKSRSVVPASYNEGYNIDGITKEFPRYIYYPDADAFHMQLTAGTKKWNIPLKSHDFLNGAFYFGGLGVSAEPDAALSLPAMASVTAPDYTNLSNRVYLSLVNNPFSFPASHVVSVGAGRIIALRPVVKALSQGQFGQFPLYAFTTEGVWALEISQTGTYLARQPVSRDVCVNPRSITQIDSAILFAADRGVMLLSGSESSCISDTIDDACFRPADLPSFSDILAASAFVAADVAAVLFADFLKVCRMVYDYTHQRVIIFAPGVPCAYVYSLASKRWGMMKSTLADSVNSYPEALAMDASGALVNISSSQTASVSALLVTRPLKLDNPDILKTVDAVIQRGYFKKGHVKTVLYGSRDLYSWFALFSSADHYLRGFRGSPYKYFRIVLLCALDDSESVYGCTVSFSPRFINQPR